MRKGLGKYQKVVLGVVAVGGFYLGSMVTWARYGLVGKVMQDRVLAQQQEEGVNQVQQLPMLAPGSVFRDPTSGKRYQMGQQTVQAVSPAGYEICRENGSLFNPPITPEDLQESNMCRDRTPYGPNCKVGGVQFLCNPTTGYRIEMLQPSDQAFSAAVTAGKLPPPPTFTAPHTGEPNIWIEPRSWLQWEAQAWAVVGEFGGISTPTGFYVYYVEKVQKLGNGNAIVTYVVETPNLGPSYTVTAVMLSI